jgi:hypothetical protein
VVAATGERPVQIATAEGHIQALGAVPNGAIVSVKTGQPWQIRVHATLADGRAYTLMLPPFAVVES